MFCKFVNLVHLAQSLIFLSVCLPTRQIHTIVAISTKLCVTLSLQQQKMTDFYLVPNFSVNIHVLFSLISNKTGKTKNKYLTQVTRNHIKLNTHQLRKGSTHFSNDKIYLVCINIVYNYWRKILLSTFSLKGKRMEKQLSIYIINIPSGFQKCFRYEDDSGSISTPTKLLDFFLA